MRSDTTTLRRHEAPTHFQWNRQPSIHDALVDLLREPIAEASARFIPSGIPSPAVARGHGRRSAGKR